MVVRLITDATAKAAAAALVGALALAGCELASDPLAPDLATPTALPTPPASNELDRLGRDDIAAGNNGLAVDHFLAATEKNRDDGFAWLGLAAAYDNLKRFDLADKAYAEATRVSGPTLAIANNKGYSYFLRGDRARALTQFDYALTLDPGNLTILNNIHLVRTGERPNRRVRP